MNKLVRTTKYSRVWVQFFEECRNRNITNLISINSFQPRNCKWINLKTSPVKYFLLSFSCLFVTFKIYFSLLIVSSVAEVLNIEAIFFTYETTIGNPITSIVEDLIKDKLSHISRRGNGEFAIEHAISIPKKFCSYNKITWKYKLLWSMHYYRN